MPVGIGMPEAGESTNLCLRAVGNTIRRLLDDKTY